MLLQASLSVGISCCHLLDWVLIRPDVTQQEDRPSTPAIGEVDPLPNDETTEPAVGSNQAVPGPTIPHRPENATPVAGHLRDGVRVRNRFRSRVEGESYSQWVFVLWLTLLVLTTTVIWTVIIVYSYYPLQDGTDQHSAITSNIDIDTLRSVALAPFGAVLRYSLWHIPCVTPYMTGNVPSLKVPTLTANVLGTLFLSLSSSIALNGSAALYTSAFNQGKHTNISNIAVADKSIIYYSILYYIIAQFCSVSYNCCLYFIRLRVTCDLYLPYLTFFTDLT